MKGFFVSIVLGAGLSLVSADPQAIEHIRALAFTVADAIHQMLA